MKRWFSRLPIHRKLVAFAVVVTTAALLVATMGLTVLDLWRYHETAKHDTEALATVLAENMGASVTFGDANAARASLATLRQRHAIVMACLYLTDGRLFASSERGAESCPSTPAATFSWFVVAGRAPVTLDDRTVGLVHVERDLVELWPRMAVATASGLAMALLAGVVALLLAHRLHYVVSRPIVELASMVRTLDPAGVSPVVRVVAGEDEVGQLVDAFDDMVGRIRDAHARLVEVNQVLLRQQADRELLLEREREANRLKDEFLAAVSHELRTPLNAIAGWVQVLTTTPATPDTTRKALASIARNAADQERVISDLMDVSRIVTGKLSIHCHSVDLRHVADSAIESTRATARAKGLRLGAAVPDQPCLVHGDRDRLHQVAWNLLSNAIKFTPEGGRVVLRIERTDGAFFLTVTDTGIGIPRTFLPHVFERFRQADGSSSREHAGLGLGLTIVKEVTELHGGNVSVVSDGPGMGATFSVQLPALAHATDVVLEEVREPAIDPRRLAGRDILAVDDSIDALEALAISLAHLGADVRSASSGDDAVAAWQQRPADVLVCDLAMPGTDGFAVLRAVRDLDRRHGRRTPAIALTAYSSPVHHTLTRDAGFDALVPKPCDLDELVTAITTVLQSADTAGRRSTTEHDGAYVS